jgi:hypothetical protein
MFMASVAEQGRRTGGGGGAVLPSAAGGGGGGICAVGRHRTIHVWYGESECEEELKSFKDDRGGPPDDSDSSF